MGSSRGRAPLRQFRPLESSTISQHTLDSIQEILLALKTESFDQDAGSCHRLAPSGTEFKGEGRTFSPNTPRHISQSASRIEFKPRVKRENRGRDRAGAMPGSKFRSREKHPVRGPRQSAESRRVTHDDTIQKVKERSRGKAYVGAIFADCRPLRRC